MLLEPEHQARVDRPDRVAMTRPSSGVNPIVVSTDRPSRTAASDVPAPRWQLMIRDAPPVISATRRATYACDSPWNPYRRSVHRARHSAGSVKVAA